MYCATANFVSQETETLLRLDTKLWFSPPLDPLSGICVGAVVGLNPGSSSPRAGEVGYAEVDSTMSKILAAFADAYAELGRALPVTFVKLIRVGYFPVFKIPKSSRRSLRAVASIKPRATMFRVSGLLGQLRPPELWLFEAVVGGSIRSVQ